MLPQAINDSLRRRRLGGYARGISAERFEIPSCGGRRGIDACQRFLLAGSVQASWGEPARPGLPPEGETERGRSRFLAAAG